MNRRSSRCKKLLQISPTITAWKVSVRSYSGPYFPAFRLNTGNSEYGHFLRNASQFYFQLHRRVLLKFLFNSAPKIPQDLFVSRHGSLLLMGSVPLSVGYVIKFSKSQDMTLFWMKRKKPFLRPFLQWFYIWLQLRGVFSR